MTEYRCNLCGESCTLCKGENYVESGGLIDPMVSGGYCSTAGNGRGALDDLAMYRFSLCEFCLDWLFAQFKVPVQVSSYMDAEEIQEPWRPASERVTGDDWRTLKAEFFAEHQKRATARCSEQKGREELPTEALV